MTHLHRCRRATLRSLLVFSLVTTLVAPTFALQMSSQQATSLAVAPASDTAQPQTQGRQYGQPGFVGEPINLNVVNADIRDIFNYITEQYGVNFVIDSSVGAVPVTVTVNEVPWNVALDAILRANRLGIDVQGSILRVATQQVLADEATTQQRIRDAQLSNEPLITEYIRLNYARASGTLAQAAGSTGGFAGGTTTDSFSGGAGGDATGGGGDQGILPIIARRLSRRGAIEVDGRSNTLIITDVRVNIDAVKQLINLLDQPEPQVEIEARIVIASRNFSRDIGVQLNAIAIGNRGSVGSIATGPGSPGVAPVAGQPSAPGNPTGIGTRPGGLPQGALNPSNPLISAASNTVIGLTTGIIGTAQISALITAGEQKGQAKVIASPRVTALNNRPAQIESGSQIPIVTTQGGGAAGGAIVFTTTYVSVPLRLSVTPQITDAGTVLLRVVAENNSVDGSIITGQGTPGISTQRMQTEVLVPDGGTTVVGGVLSDNELQNIFRTPGAGSLPFIGNLFKRRQTSRQTAEILFFITPRIYRPDFNGNPLGSVAATGTRSTTILQPVEPGNVQSNTPTPTQLQERNPSIAPNSIPSPTSINAPSTPVSPVRVVPNSRP